MNSKVWNHILIRFLVSLAFWEALSFPLKMLFFSKFYYSNDFKSFFTPVTDINWIIPAIADMIQIFATGLIVSLARPSLPEKLAGGFLAGLILSGIFVGITLFIQSFTSLFPTEFLWMWCLYEVFLSLTVAIIYTVESD